MSYRSFLTLHQQLKDGIEDAHREHVEKMKGKGESCDVVVLAVVAAG
jgi:hypothetical protein